eukprot:SAG11_NODE_18001_length_502_cov_1.885856_1_plen_55_part_10
MQPAPTDIPSLQDVEDFVATASTADLVLLLHHAAYLVLQDFRGRRLSRDAGAGEA